MRKLELLHDSHDRAGFDCGNEDLNRFLAHTARQHIQKGISRTFVLVDEAAVAPKPILGYFSLTVCHIESSLLTDEIAKKLPRVAPVVKLGRLAVAKQIQRQGLGKALMGAVLSKCIIIFESAGGIGLFVDAKNDEARSFYESFGFVSLPANELQLFLPAQTILSLVGK